MPTNNLATLKLKVLSDISAIIGKAFHLEDALRDVLRILSETLSMQRATVTLLDNDTGRLVILASHGLSYEEQRRGVYRLDEGVTGAIFRSGKPYYVPDTAAEPLFLDKTGARKIARGKLSFLGVPIMYQGGPLGVLNVDRLFTNDVSPEEDIDFLTVVATLIAQLVGLNAQVRDRVRHLEQENASLKYQVAKENRGPYIVGRSVAMKEVEKQMERVAPTRATVLLLGESGVGKTLIARIIRDLSDRRDNPFIKVNCASIPENLLESELFGYEKGAFTGATSAKPGRFEDAHSGTIFLDEIGELPLGLQAKLLRVIQDRELERLGSNRTRTVDVRILAATNRDLETLVEEGTFRGDLYYRLNVFPIRVPTLRERREDVVGLITHFLGKVSDEYGRRLILSDAAVNLLRNYEWPGNVREMENLIERLVIMAESERISADFIRPFLTSTPEPLDKDAAAPISPRAEPAPVVNKTLKDLEREEVVQALKRNGWVQYKAATDLGLTPRQMGYRVKKFGLEGLIATERARLRS